MSLLSLYNTFLARHPIVANSITGFFIAGAGDVLCQMLIENRHITVDTNASFRKHAEKVEKKGYEIDVLKAEGYDSIEWNRTLRMGLIRSFIVSPFVVKLYPLVNRLSPGPYFHNVLGRVAIDQIFGSPTVILMVFTASAMLGNTGLTSLLHRLHTEGVSAWLKGLQYWPFVHCITFSGLIPPQHTILWGHVMAIYWNGVLSYYSHTPLSRTAAVATTKID
jgi:hypothetical protein